MNAITTPRVALAPGSRSLVLGLGRTGLSCARYLHRNGIEVRLADTRPRPPGYDQLRAELPELELRTGPFSLELLDGTAQVVLSPGLSVREPVVVEARRRGLPVVGDIELFARAAPAPVAAVTGTNGKSTVTTLIAELATAAGRRAIAGGNLGEPALDLLAGPVPDLYVLEVSSFQLETTYSLAARAATVLNVTPDHMDRYDGMADYAAAKARIFDHCEVAVVNVDDALVRGMPRADQQMITFSLAQAGADYTLVERPEPALARNGVPLVPLASLRIQGRHNAANALAALAMSEALEVPAAPCIEALCRFAGLPHRSQWVGEVAGVRFVNDSKGTNVGATVAAVTGMDGPLVVIAGGDGKNADFGDLREAFRGRVRHVVLIGKDAPRIEAALDGVVRTERADDLAAAVQAAHRAARRGDTVLLSPACASLDMFRDYAQRGEVFAAAVRSLAS